MYALGRWTFLLSVLLLGSATAQQISSGQCASFEPVFTGSLPTIRRNMEQMTDLGAAMTQLAPLLSSRPRLQAAMQDAALAAETAGTSSKRLVEALEDLQYQLRLCARNP